MATEVPIEFVSVTETGPIALKSPVNGNGICRSKAPPAFWPFVLPNHDVAPDLSITVKLVPVNCAPGTGVKLTTAFVRSRGVELAWRSTVNPKLVTLIFPTDPGTISGINRRTVIDALGGDAGSAIIAAVPVR